MLYRGGAKYQILTCHLTVAKVLSRCKSLCIFALLSKFSITSVKTDSTIKTIPLRMGITSSLIVMDT